MALPTVRTKWLLLFLLLLPFGLSAQDFTVRMSGGKVGSYTLTIFDGDSTYHTQSVQVRKGDAVFQGSVARPVLASISHTSFRQPIYFFLENSEITIQLNPAAPESSPIKGSRSNSEYRYIVECLGTSGDAGSYLRQYVRGNPGSIYAPYLLYTQQPNLDDVQLRQLYELLDGAALHTYHYWKLTGYLRQVPALAEGCVMPDFEFFDGHRKVHFEQVRSKESKTLLFFGAKWCDRCKEQQLQAAVMLKEKPTEMVVVRLDDDSRGWDAPYVSQLGIAHLPYIILIDSDGIVLARDLRIWELEKYK